MAEERAAVDFDFEEKTETNEGPGRYVHGPYAVIETAVLHNRALPPGAKILYADISSLCNQKGYCWAGDAYFARIYEVSERTICRWILALKKAGVIKVTYQLTPGTQEVATRLIRLAWAEVVTILSTRGDTGVTTCRQNCPEVVTNLSLGGDKNVGENIISINNIKAAASDEPRDAEEEEAAAAASTPTAVSLPGGRGSLKRDLAAVDRRLVFDASFYPRAEEYLKNHALGPPFYEWLLNYCRKKEPRDIRAMFAKLFFQEDLAELYLSTRPKERSPPPPVACPVCGKLHPPGKNCPICGLSANANERQIARATAVFALPPKKRAEYKRRVEVVYAGGKDFRGKVAALREIDREFGIPET